MPTKTGATLRGDTPHEKTPLVSPRIVFTTRQRIHLESPFFLLLVDTLVRRKNVFACKKMIFWIFLHEVKPQNPNIICSSQYFQGIQLGFCFFVCDKSCGCSEMNFGVSSREGVSPHNVTPEWQNNRNKIYSMYLQQWRNANLTSVQRSINIKYQLEHVWVRN